MAEQLGWMMIIGSVLMLVLIVVTLVVMSMRFDLCRREMDRLEEEHMKRIRVAMGENRGCGHCVRAGFCSTCPYRGLGSGGEGRDTMIVR